MTIDKILLHVADVRRSVGFYERFLAARPVGAVTADRAELDLHTTTLELIHLAGGVPSTRADDDIHRGFRHLGFKVPDVDGIVAELRAASVPITLGPANADFVGVYLAFFLDPDGTVLEIVEGHLDYDEVFDADEERRERSASRPASPRFDHVAQSCCDIQRRGAELVELGFTRVGRAKHPDPRGFWMDFYRGGDTIVEAFTFDVATVPSRPRLDSLGFVAVRMAGALPPSATPLGVLADGRLVSVDGDDLTYVEQ